MPPPTLRLRPITLSRTVKSSPFTIHHPVQRPFVTDALTPSIQSLSATRTLPYPAAALFDLIADISSYPQFIPYCTSSTITSTSAPHPTTKSKYPQSATLRIGWGPYDEDFHSAVYCVPHSVVEAVAGDAKPTLTSDDISHHTEIENKEHVSGNRIFKSLLTRWTLREYPFKPPPPNGKNPRTSSATSPSRPRTEVGLNIEVQFASKVYAALSQAAAPKVAGIMVDAFEKRAREVLGDGNESSHESRVMQKDTEESGLEGAGGGEGITESATR